MAAPSTYKLLLQAQQAIKQLQRDLYASITQLIAIKGQTNVFSKFSSQANGSTITTISFSEKKCSWGAGFNDSGTTYYYLAICKEAFA